MLHIAHRSVADLTPHDTAYSLLGELYRQVSGENMPEISRSSRGKPYFPSGKFHFSITHTRRHVFCALSDVPVGIDAEETDRRIDLRLAQKILSPAEYGRFLGCPDPGAALLRLWVLKEAEAKCSGLGLRGYPNHTDFSPEDPRIREIHGCYVAVIVQEAHHAL